MSHEQLLPTHIQPVISYPHKAQVGRTYLVTIDLYQTGEGIPWPFEDGEEYPIYFMLETV